jgi:4-amino-4-deoxy-L-arabinose transferase-like glycosyltransferase
MNSTFPPTSHQWKDILLLFLVIAGSYGLFLGARALGIPDEARYAEIPREMLAKSQFMLPHLNGILYFEKPPLFYWMVSATIALFGNHEAIVRLSTVSMGIFTILLNYLCARKLFDRATGICTAFILASSLLFYAMAHLNTLDMTLTFFLAGSLNAFLLATHYPPGFKRRGFILLAAACAALAVLTKGLIGIVLPGLIVVCWIALFQRWKMLKSLYLPSAVLLFMAIVLPWHFIAQSKVHDFLSFYVLKQQFLRYSTLSAGRYKPNWFFIPILLAATFPWTGFLFQSIQQTVSEAKKSLSQNTAPLFFLLWAGIIFLFFSFSKSKLIPYILPCLPPLSILIARYIIKARTSPLRRGFKIGLGVSTLFSFIFAIFLLYMPHFIAIPSPLLAMPYLIVGGTCLMLVNVISLYCIYKKKMSGAFFLLSIGSIFTYSVLTLSLPGIDDRSIKPFIPVIEHIRTPNTEIIAYAHYYQDLPYYLKQKVSVADWVNELDFGIHHQHAEKWIYSKKVFWNHFKSKQKVIVLSRNKDFGELVQAHPKHLFYLLFRNHDNTLFTNRKP